MSDTSQGPGWWLASDGKWYPPEQAPGAAPATPPPTAPPSTPPPGTPPPKKSTSKGCIYAIIAVGILVFVVIIGSVLAVTFLGKKVADNASNLIGSSDCELIKVDQVDSIMGGSYTLYQVGKLLDQTMPDVDGRVLGTADVTCWATEDSGSTIVTLARDTGNASTRYDQARQAAQSGGYLGSDLSNGDEGFCTTDTNSYSFAAGALVRSGDQLVYVSIFAPPNGTDTSAELTNDQRCQLAAQLADKALG